jgi:hypothetical protein
VPDPVAPALSAAGIVKTPGIDDVLERVEEAADFAAYRKKFFEGEELSKNQVEQKRQLLTRIVREVNLHLAGRVRIIGGWPELNGFGARLEGRDSDDREYKIEYHADDEMRMANEPEDKEKLVREVIDMITTEILAQRARYLSRMTGKPVGV